MQIYLVGGAVRDALLNRPVTDRDWVVVGANETQMLAHGFQKVGKDFPVFLHPQTHEEYALARRERKTAPGYTGFSVDAAADVSLEEDLSRRDLTINAMAQAEDGTLIDPFGGQEDLRRGLLRHVSPAFSEDPVRILRLARFAARFGFQAAPQTMALMRQMVASGEVDALVPERVWQELARGLMEAYPARMLEILRECGALAKLLPEVDALFGVPQRADYHPEIDTGVHTLMVLTRAAHMGCSLPERYAALLHDVGKALTPAEILPRHIGHEAAGVPLIKAVNERLKVPQPCARLALLVGQYHTLIHQVPQLKPATVLKVLQRCDAFRRGEAFQGILNACQADAQGRLGFEEAPYPQRQRWQTYLQAALGVDAAAIAAQYTGRPEKIAQALASARTAAIAAASQSLTPEIST